MNAPISVKNEFNHWISTLDDNDLNETDKKLLNLLADNINELYPLGRQQSQRAKKIGKLIEEKGENANSAFPETKTDENQNLEKVTKLTKLEIGPFRGFRQEETFNFDKNYSYLYGPNGSGKSSFCEGLEYSLLGEIEECETKRIPLQEYLKNVDVGRWEPPTAFGILKGEEVLISPFLQLYRFCFIEKNRIDSFARLSATTPKNQQAKISALFGLDAFNQFVENFTDTLVDKHITLTNTLKVEFDALQVSHKKNEEALQEENENLQGLKNEIKDLVEKFNEPTVTNLEEVKKYLDGDRNSKGKIAQLQEQVVAVLPENIDSKTKEYVDIALKDLQTSVLTFKEKLKEYSGKKEDVNYRDLYDAVRNISSQGDISDSVCPACLTPLANTTINPFEHAEEQLEILKIVSELEDQLRETAADISEKISELNQRVLNFNKIIPILKLDLEPIKEINAPDFENKKAEIFIFSVTSQLEKLSFHEEKREIIIEKIKAYNGALEAKRRQKSVLEEQQRKYSGLRDNSISIEAREKGLLEKISGLKSKIKTFNGVHKDTILKISEMEKVVGRNEQFRESYTKLIGHLKKYRDSLPSSLAKDLGLKAAEFYNVINQNDPDFEKIEELFLPSESGHKIEILFKQSQNKFDALQVLSEGHIKCLGLALLLSKAVKEGLNFLVFDDIVNAIDDDHRGGIIELLMSHGDLKNKQQIITCHGPEFVKNLENKLDVKERNKMVNNVQFTPPDIINERGVQVKYADSHHYLALAEKHLANDMRRESLSNCRKAVENILEAFWNRMGRKVEFQLSVPRRTPNAKPDARNVLIAILGKLNKEIFAETKEIKESFEKLNSDKLWQMLNKGTHEEGDGIPEFERADIQELLNLLVELESKIKSNKVGVTVAAK